MLLIDLHWLQIKRASDISVYLFVLIDQNKAKIKIFDSISIIHWKCIQIPVEKKKSISVKREKRDFFFYKYPLSDEIESNFHQFINENIHVHLLFVCVWVTLHLNKSLSQALFSLILCLDEKKKIRYTDTW